MNEKYPKHEKLKQKKQIDLLFAKGKWQSCGNLRVISLNVEKMTDNEITVPNQKFGVSVSKRNFKKAVQRNRVKRLLRELYRHNKAAFIASFGVKSLTMLFWVSKEMPRNYSDVESDFLKLCKSKK